MLAIYSIPLPLPPSTPKVPKSERGRGAKIGVGGTRNGAEEDQNLSVKGVKIKARKTQARSWLGVMGAGSISGRC